MVIDASGEGRYGYGMRLTLGDSQFDFSLLPERQVNPQWDGAWDGRTQIVEEGWSAETLYTLVNYAASPSRG